MRNLPHSSAQIKHASAMSVQNIPATIQKIMTSFRPYFAKIKQVPEPALGELADAPTFQLFERNKRH